LKEKADIIIHHIDKTNPAFEFIPFCQVEVIPVCAPKFFNSPITSSTNYNDINEYTQCIIRDSASNDRLRQNHFVNRSSTHITVGDQQTKKQVILQSMAWGHMPNFLIDEELKSKTLISIEGKFIQKHIRDIVVARRNSPVHGKMLNKLWGYFTNINPT